MKKNLRHLAFVSIAFLLIESIIGCQLKHEKSRNNGVAIAEINKNESTPFNVKNIIATKKPLISSYWHWLKEENSMASQALEKNKNEKAQGMRVFIIGGEKTQAFPAVGAILLNGKIHCTGTLISRMTVLTAAHCVYGYYPGQLKFVLGSNVNAATKKYNVTGANWDEKYLPFPKGINDIAVLYLQTPVAEILPMPIPKHDLSNVLEGAQPTFVGFGYTLPNQGGELGTKRQVSMPIQLVKEDQTTFRYQVSGKNTCNVDSGGPAIYQSQVVGVTSWGDDPCMTFGVDMRVDAYIDWLAMNVK